MFVQVFLMDDLNTFLQPGATVDSLWQTVCQ